MSFIKFIENQRNFTKLMKYFYYADIIDGYADSDGFMYVRPDQDITRAQFVKIIVSALNLKTDGPGKTFKDVKSR